MLHAGALHTLYIIAGTRIGICPIFRDNSLISPGKSGQVWVMNNPWPLTALLAHIFVFRAGMDKEELRLIIRDKIV